MALRFAGDLREFLVPSGDHWWPWVVAGGFGVSWVPSQGHWWPLDVTGGLRVLQVGSGGCRWPWGVIVGLGVAGNFMGSGMGWGLQMASGAHRWPRGVTGGLEGHMFTNKRMGDERATNGKQSLLDRQMKIQTETDRQTDGKTDSPFSVCLYSGPEHKPIQYVWLKKDQDQDPMTES
jgi:hypothetical protein